MIEDTIGTPPAEISEDDLDTVSAARATSIVLDARDDREPTGQVIILSPTR